MSEFYPDGLLQTQPCQQCGKKMILVCCGYTLTSYPAQHPTEWVCYGCGLRTEGPTLQEKTTEELQRERWERANQEER